LRIRKTEEIYMTNEEFSNLKAGDVVQNKGSASAYIVTGNYGDGGVTMVKTLLSFNPSEWDKVPPNNED
jgi:hypothetical protein